MNTAKSLQLKNIFLKVRILLMF